MTLTVKDAVDLGILAKMTLVAGGGGLDREVTKAGVLEYEIITGSYHNFQRGEFIMSSLTHAHNDEALLLAVFEALNQVGVSGVAVKTILFSELPACVLAFADEAKLPVFTFGDDLYYEDIILPLASKIDIYKGYNYREQIIERLLQNQAGGDDLAQELNVPGLTQPVCMVFRSRSAPIDKNRTIALLESARVKNLFDPGSVGIAFQNGFLILLNNTTAATERLPYNHYHGIVKNMGINTADYYIGVSNPHPVTQVLLCIQEAYFTAKVALLHGREIYLTADTGAFQILMSRDDSDIQKTYSDAMLAPLIQYDTENGANLYETALSYIRKKGLLKDTAAEMFQHVNTIRYRINKMKSLLNYTSSDYIFFSDLALAVNIRLLQQIP